MPNSNIVPGISNPSKDIVVFRQSERPTAVERTRPAFWYNTSNSGTYFWDTKLNDWVPVSAFGTTTTTTTTASPLDTCLTKWDITTPLVASPSYEFITVVNANYGYLAYFKGIDSRFYTSFYNSLTKLWEDITIMPEGAVYGFYNGQPYINGYTAEQLNCWFNSFNNNLEKNGQKIKTIYSNSQSPIINLGFDENNSLYIWDRSGNMSSDRTSANKFIAVENDPSQQYMPLFTFNPSVDSMIFNGGNGSISILHIQPMYFTFYELKRGVYENGYTIKSVGGYSSPQIGPTKILGNGTSILYKMNRSIVSNPNIVSSGKTSDWKEFATSATPASDGTSTDNTDIILSANGQYLYQLQVVNGQFVWTPRDIGLSANWERVIALSSYDIFLQAKTSDGYIIARSSCVPAVTTTTTTLPPCGSDWIPSSTSLNLKASWNQIVNFNRALYLFSIDSGLLFMSQSVDGIKWSAKTIACSTTCKSANIVKVVASGYNVFILGDKNEIFESKISGVGGPIISFSVYDAGYVHYKSTLYRSTRVEVVNIFASVSGAFAVGKNNRIFIIEPNYNFLTEFAYNNANATGVITANRYKFSAFIPLQFQNKTPKDNWHDNKISLCDVQGGFLIGAEKSVVVDSSFLMGTITDIESAGSSAFVSNQYIERPPMDSEIIISGNGNYVVLYKNNTISYSENALHWTTKAIPAGKWNNLLYLNGYFILVGLGKSIYISKTLQENSWQERNVVDSGDWYGVVFSSKLFISSVYPDKVMWKVSDCLFESIPEPILCNTYTTAYDCARIDCLQCVCGGSTGEFATLLECQQSLYSQRTPPCPYPNPPTYYCVSGAYLSEINGTYTFNGPDLDSPNGKGRFLRYSYTGAKWIITSLTQAYYIGTGFQSYTVPPSTWEKVPSWGIDPAPTLTSGACSTTPTTTTTTTTTTSAPTTTTLAPTKNAPDAVSVLFGLPYLSKFDQNTQAPLTDIRLGFTYLGSSSNIETNGTLSITTSDPEFYVGVKDQSYWSKTSKSPNISWTSGYGAYSFSTNDYRDLQLVVYWTGNNPSVFNNNATHQIILTFSVLLANGTTITTTGIVNLKRDASVAYQVMSSYSDPATWDNIIPSMPSQTAESVNNPILTIEANKYAVTTSPINIFIVDKNAIVANNFNINENSSSYFELNIGNSVWWAVPEATIAPNNYSSSAGIRIPIVNGKGTIAPFTIGLSSQYREGSWRKVLAQKSVVNGKEGIYPFYTSYRISPSNGSVNVNFNTIGLPMIVQYTEPMECISGVVVDGKLIYAPVSNGGFGYESVPEIRIVGGDGDGAQATAEVYNGVIARINITNQGSGYTSRPVIMASNSICPECPKIPIPTCPPGRNCLQTNYNYSGICPASYTCIPCPTTTTTTTTTTLDPNFPLATCQVPASSFAISFISSTNVSSSTFPEMELNSDGYFPLGKIKFDFYHTENDLGTLWRGYNCATKSVRVDIQSVTVKTSHPDFIVTNGISKSNQVKNLSYPDCGISYVAPGWFESIFYCVHWIGSDPSIFTGSNPVEVVLTFEIKVNSFTDGTQILSSGYIATLTQYV